MTNPFVGLPLVLLAPALIVGGTAGIALPLLDVAGPTELGPAAGVLLIAFGLAVGPPLLNLHGRWTRVLLAPESARAAVRGQARMRSGAATGPTPLAAC